MNAFRRLFGVALILSGSAVTFFAQDGLVVTDTKSEYDFSGRLRVVLDPSNSKTLDDLLPELARTPPLPAAEPNFGFTADTIWCLARVDNRSSQTRFLFYLDFNLDDVSLSYFEPNRPAGAVRMTSGAFVPDSRKPYLNRFPVFPVTLEPGKTYDVVIAVKTSGSAVVPLRLFTPAAFDAYNGKLSLFLGVMFGILAGLTVFVLLLILMTRNWSFIYHIFFSVFHIVFQLAYNGIIGRYVLRDRPALVEGILVISIVATIVFGTVFAQVFLGTRKRAPVFHKAFIGLIAASLAVVPFSLLGFFRVSIVMANASMAAAALLITVCSVRMFVTGNRTARFYMLAYVSLIASVIVITLKNFGILPSTFFTAQCVLLGSVVEGVLLSLAVADRINILRSEHQRMQAELLSSRENEIKILKEKFYLDSMTGMANRNRMILDLQKLGRYALFIVNIDGFRKVNDLYGTVIGNQILIETARRLKSFSLPRPHHCYRLQSDEFALLVPGGMTDPETMHIADWIRLVCQERPFVIDLYVIPLSCTIGAAVGTEDVLKHADMALAYAKETGKPFTVYSPELDMSNQIRDNLDCIQLLRNSIDQGMVYPVFMPILNNGTNKVEKYETLMRLRDPSGKIYTPGEFITVAKRSKLYPFLSRSLIRQGIEFFSSRPYEFTLNLSVNDILDRESTALIWEGVERHPCKGNIGFEILESESIEAYEPVAEFIAEAKRRGCKIALDDFGSGYSNFEHILRLDVDYLKIDASLIRDMHTDRNARMVVETIAQFARRLKVKTIAEFVHCEDVFNLVRYMGINFSQGAFIGMPQERLVERV
ncbi:MAG: EAL domain-containing protein [Spirochaetales bacterium]|nr:EAL domain-containing protein [Spirochaetales bacterium]